MMGIAPSTGRAYLSLARYLIVWTAQAPVHPTSITFSALEDYFGLLTAGQKAFLLACRQTPDGYRGPAGAITDDIT
jgi:hypothetical protein